MATSVQSFILICIPFKTVILDHYIGFVTWYTMTSKTAVLIIE